ENGNLKSEITIKNKRKNGPAKKYYTTGELHTLVNYVNNIKEGEAVWYYKNGQPYRITQYNNNKITGVRKLFYEDGTLMAEIPYQNNEPVIGLKEYNKNGALLTNYPEIVFSTKNLIKEENLFTINCQLSNHSKNAKFYQELEGSDGKERLFEISTKNGIGKLDFRVPARVKGKKTITLYAKTESTLGNPYFTKKSFTFSFDTY
ncbi:MAG: toxin-antitoxin system YwqK family antitoxin, partial [Bacteroidota bacterium]